MTHHGHRPGASEMALVDVGTVLGLQRRLGAERCQELVEDTIYAVTDRVARAERALDRNDLKQGLMYARELVSLCHQIGLSRMARVATDLTETLDQDDQIAANAVIERLGRYVGDQVADTIDLDHLALDAVLEQRRRVGPRRWRERRVRLAEESLFCLVTMDGNGGAV